MGLHPITGNTKNRESEDDFQEPRNIEHDIISFPSVGIP